MNSVGENYSSIDISIGIEEKRGFEVTINQDIQIILNLKPYECKRLKNINADYRESSVVHYKR